MARRPEPSFRRSDPAAMVRSVGHLEKAAFERAGIHLDIQVVDGDDTVPMDENQLRRALINVLENARHSGANHVTVSCNQTGEFVEIRVKDNGRGMDDLTARQAFEPFFSTRPRGTGLGLAITHQILEDHGGQVLCDSRPEQGCEIKLLIPKASG